MPKPMSRRPHKPLKGLVNNKALDDFLGGFLNTAGTPTTGRDILTQGLNRFGHALSFITKEKHSNYTQTGAHDQLLPPEQAVQQHEYHQSMSLYGTTQLNENLLSDYLKETIKDPSGLYGVDVETLNSAQIKEALDEVSDEITQALTTSPNNAKAMDEVKKEILALNKILTDKDAYYHPQDVIHFVNVTKDNALKAIQAKRGNDLKQVGDLFGKPGDAPTAFVQKLQGKGLNSEQITRLQAKITEKIEDAHKKATENLTKSIDDYQKLQHAKAQTEAARVSFLATMYHNNEDVKRKINQMYLDNRAARADDDEGSLQLLTEEGSPRSRAIFKGINVGDFKTIETLTGRTLALQDDGSYVMELPNRILNGVGYYSSSHQNVKSEMLVAAAALRARGFSGVKMSITHQHDQEYAMEIGRIQYEACREAGFPANEIKINVNGVEYSGDKIKEELFKDHESEYSHVESVTASKYEKEREELSKTSTGSNARTQKEFRQMVLEGRALTEKLTNSRDVDEPPVAPAINV